MEKKKEKKKKQKGGKKWPSICWIYLKIYCRYIFFIYILYFDSKNFYRELSGRENFSIFFFPSKEIIDRAIQRIEHIFIYTDRIKIKKKKRRKKKKRLRRRRSNYRITLILISIKTNFSNERLCNLYANYATQAFLLNPSIITIWIILYFILIP